MASSAIALQAGPAPLPKRDWSVATKHTLLINEKRVPVVFTSMDIPEDREEMVLTSRNVVNWVAGITTELKLGHKFAVNGVVISGVKWFGNNVGFVYIDADITSINEKPGAGAAMFRGDSVAMLPVISTKGNPLAKKKTIITVQPRFPVAQIFAEEIPAGMMDHEHNFKGVAAKEIEEELGLKAKPEDLINLTELYVNKGKIFPSPGGCDEGIVLFAWPFEMTEKELEECNGKLTGNYAEGESITLRVIDLDNLVYISDPKAHSALLLYTFHCMATGQPPASSSSAASASATPAPAARTAQPPCFLF